MLKGKVILVTGGAGLIGSEFVRAIAKNNGIAIIGDVDESNARKIINESPELKIDFFKLNITSKESVQKVLSQIIEKYKSLDALVNNAYPRNASYGKKFEEVSYEDFCGNVNLHLGGYFLMSQQASLIFVKQGHGNIINMSSIYGVMAPRFEIYENTEMTMPVEYAVIKSALIHLTKYMAKYFKGQNIRVNSISPGGVYNNQNAQFKEAYKKQSISKGMLDKSDLSGSLVYLLSDMSTYVNGQNIIVDDGFSL